MSRLDMPRSKCRAKLSEAKHQITEAHKEAFGDSLNMGTDTTQRIIDMIDNAQAYLDQAKLICEESRQK